MLWTTAISPWRTRSKISPARFCRSVWEITVLVMDDVRIVPAILYSGPGTRMPSFFSRFVYSATRPAHSARNSELSVSYLAASSFDAPGGEPMRTTISLPDEIYSEAKDLAGERSFSEFASDAIQERILWLKRERLAREMEEGYRSEAASPSLDPEWAGFEVEEL